MTTIKIAAVAHRFDRDLEACFTTIGDLLDAARAQQASLVVLPEAALGGYLSDLDGPVDLPPALHRDGPEIDRLAQ
nr:carbon-nitrogen hydrolase family protein [Actinomycetota bacterium]